MKDQIIHTLVISAAILGAGFVVGTIVRDKPQVVAKAQPKVDRTNVVNDQLKDLIIANERQENELSQQAEEISKLKKEKQQQVEDVRRISRNYNNIINKNRNNISILAKNQATLDIFNKLVGEMQKTRSLMEGDSHPDRRIHELSLQNNKLLKEGEEKVGRMNSIGAGPARRKISITEKIKAMSPENRIKYVENKMLIVALFFSVKAGALEKLSKPQIANHLGQLIPVPPSHINGVPEPSGRKVFPSPMDSVLAGGVSGGIGIPQPRERRSHVKGLGGALGGAKVQK